MAIKVVNGLLDVSAPIQDGGETGVAVESKAVVPSENLRDSPRPIAAQFGFNDEITRDLPPKVQAALEKLQRYSAGRERDELRSIDQAEQLAAVIATRITEDDDGARASHAELATSTAQEHLMQ